MQMLSWWFLYNCGAHQQEWEPSVTLWRQEIWGQKKNILKQLISVFCMCLSINFAFTLNIFLKQNCLLQRKPVHGCFSACFLLCFTLYNKKAMNIHWIGFPLSTLANLGTVLPDHCCWGHSPPVTARVLKVPHELGSGSWNSSGLPRNLICLLFVK